jgi:hypothetical protein
MSRSREDLQGGPEMQLSNMKTCTNAKMHYTFSRPQTGYVRSLVSLTTTIIVLMTVPFVAAQTATSEPQLSVDIGTTGINIVAKYADTQNQPPFLHYRRYQNGAAKDTAYNSIPPNSINPDNSYTYLITTAMAALTEIQFDEIAIYVDPIPQDRAIKLSLSVFKQMNDLTLSKQDNARLSQQLDKISKEIADLQAQLSIAQGLAPKELNLRDKRVLGDKVVLLFHTDKPAAVKATVNNGSGITKTETSDGYSTDQRIKFDGLQQGHWTLVAEVANSGPNKITGNLVPPDFDIVSPKPVVSAQLESKPAVSGTTIDVNVKLNSNAKRVFVLIKCERKTSDQIDEWENCGTKPTASVNDTSLKDSFGLHDPNKLKSSVGPFTFDNLKPGQYRFSGEGYDEDDLSLSFSSSITPSLPKPPPPLVFASPVKITLTTGVNVEWTASTKPTKAYFEIYSPFKSSTQTGKLMVEQEGKFSGADELGVKVDLPTEKIKQLLNYAKDKNSSPPIFHAYMEDNRGQRVDVEMQLSFIPTKTVELSKENTKATTDIAAVSANPSSKVKWSQVLLTTLGLLLK